jgi:phosphoglycerate dehydrogenase-like enzyme
MDRPVYEALFDRAALDRLTALADTDPSLLVRDFADRTAADDVTDPEVLPPDSPLYDLPNVLLTPHIAGSPGNELGRLAHAALDELERYASGLPYADPVRAERLTHSA